MHRRQCVAIPPHPVFVLRCRKRLNVDENVPVWRIAAKTLKGRRAPNAPRIGGISPGIEQLSSTAVGNRNIARAIKNCLEDFVINRHTFVAETFQRLRILCFDPVEHRSALNLLQPEMGVIIRGFEGGPRIGSGHDQSPFESLRYFGPSVAQRMRPCSIQAELPTRCNAKVGRVGPIRDNSHRFGYSRKRCNVQPNRAPLQNRGI
jgi:hypothetical protein